jgi:hypothetical protein
VLHNISTHGLVEVKDDLTVGLGLEMGSLGAHLAESVVVVDLAVDGQDQGLVVVGQGLSSRLNTDNGKTLVAENVVASNSASAPIGTTVTELLGKKEGALTEGVGIAGQVVDSKDTAHGDLIVCIREERREEESTREKGDEQEATTRAVDKGRGGRGR